MNGLAGRSGPGRRCPGARAPPVAAGAGEAGDAGAAGGAGGAGAAGAARAKGAPRAAGTTGAPTRGAAGGPAGSEVADGVGAGGGRNTGAAGGAGRPAGAGGAGGPGGAGGAGGAGRGATNGPDKRGGAAGVGVGGPGAAGTGRAGGIAPALPAPTAKTVLQTVQRVRTPAAGTLAGSTRYTVSHDGQVTFTPTASLALFRVVVQLLVVPAVDHEHRPWLRLGVALHLGRQLAYLRRMREAAVLIRDDPDRQRHQRHPVQLAAAVLPKVVPSAPVLFVVLVRDERIEHFEHVPAHVGDRLEWNHADEIVPPDVPHEAAAAQLPFHHVVEDARQDVDDAIAVVVAVAIVVLLEVVELGIAHGEQVACLHAPPDLALDLRGTGQAGRGVHGHVPRRAGEQAVEPAHLLGRLEQRGDHLARARLEPRLHLVGGVPAADGSERHDGGVGVRLQPRAQLQPLFPPVGVDDHERR